MTLPARPARIRIATAAESAQQPAPNMRPPRLVDNRGEQGEFVLPLNIPSADPLEGQAVPTTSPSRRPRGRSPRTKRGPATSSSSPRWSSTACRRPAPSIAFNSTNVEGWGLYAETHRQAVHAARGPADLAAAPAAARGPRLQRSGAAAGADHARTGEAAADGGRRAVGGDGHARRSSATRSARPARRPATSTATRGCCSCAPTSSARSAPASTRCGSTTSCSARGCFRRQLLRKAVMQDFVPSASR